MLSRENTNLKTNNFCLIEGFECVTNYLFRQFIVKKVIR